MEKYIKITQANGTEVVLGIFRNVREDIRIAARRVHGNGGCIVTNAYARLQLAIDRATNGRDTGYYEPAPGHVRAYMNTRDGRLDEFDVDLRGATIAEYEAPMIDYQELISGRNQAE